MSLQRERIKSLEKRLGRIEQYAKRYLDHPNPLNTLAYELISNVYRIARRAREQAPQ